MLKKLVLVSALALSACVVRVPGPLVNTDYAPVAPPAPRVEVVTVRPSPRHTWTAGYWSWRGGRWLWALAGGSSPARAMGGSTAGGASPGGATSGSPVLAARVAS